MSKSPVFPNQVVPLLLTFVVCAAGVGVLFLEIKLLNLFVVAREPIVPVLRLSDILIGMTIYLKTSIDFAIFIGRLMQQYPGWKNRILIEIGTIWQHCWHTGNFVNLGFVPRSPSADGCDDHTCSLSSFANGRGGAGTCQRWNKNIQGEFWRIWAVARKILHSFNQMVAPVLSRLVPQDRYESWNEKRQSWAYLSWQ